MAAQEVLSGVGLSKSFGPIEVVHGVDIDVRAGEVHALVGENGAGKSTLMKTLSGYLAPSSGEVRLDGAPVTFRDSNEAEAAGVVLIHQELNLVPHLTVEENIFLGREPHRYGLVDRSATRRATRELLDSLRTDVPVTSQVRELSVSQAQMVEIAKAVSREVRVLCMDEPTDVLTGRETEVLFDLVRRLVADGVAVLYVSHKLEEVKAIADRVTIMRDGYKVGTYDVADLTPVEMARRMVGRDLADMYPPKRPPADDAPVALEIEAFSVPGLVTGASLAVRRGEVLGVAGLIGAGRTELFEGVLGLRPSVGTVRKDGREVKWRHPADAKRDKVAYLTEDRKGKGLLLNSVLRENVTLQALELFAKPFVDLRAEQGALERAVDEFDVRVRDLTVPAKALSGGNQQKVVLAKMMLTDPDVVILDEPTRGIDVGTKRQIYFYVAELLERGVAIVLISSELPEVLGLSHRVAVMRRGVVTGVLSGDDLNEETVMAYATGLRNDSHVAEWEMHGAHVGV
ncbi:MAG TPA: sugar ABC transporter ATP-binding protein [Trueperaceae bacterium]|nr:sugar ABC transporter ATP-binding protein [Trueperaceae bacterium]